MDRRERDATYLLVRISETSRLLDRAEDRDVAYEAIVMDHLNERYGGFGIEVIDCEAASNAHGSIAHHVRELLPCAPEDDWWQQSGARPEPAPVSDFEIEAGAKALVDLTDRDLHYRPELVASKVLTAARTAREGSN